MKSSREEEKEGRDVVVGSAGLEDGWHNGVPLWGRERDRQLLCLCFRVACFAGVGKESSVPLGLLPWERHFPERRSLEEGGE